MVVRFASRLELLCAEVPFVELPEIACIWMQLKWLLETSKTLQLVVPLDWRAALGVTPQIISTDIAQQLGSWIEHRFRVKSWTEYLLEFLPPAYNKV